MSRNTFTCKNTNRKFTHYEELMSKSDFDFVNNVYPSNSWGDWLILGKSNKKNLSGYLFIIKNLTTGTVKLSQKSNIKSGSVKDNFYPNVSQVGFTGDVPNVSSHFLYSRWVGMIGRCYNQNHSKYKFYGGKGVTVDERWHNFSNFIKDCKCLSGYDENLVKNNELTLEKDELQQDATKDNMIYSKENCRWRTLQENLNIMIKDNGRIFKGVKDGVALYHYCNKRMGKILNINRKSIEKCLNKKQSTANGFVFKYINKLPNGWTLDNCSKRNINIINKYNNINKRELTDGNRYFKIENDYFTLYHHNHTFIANILKINRRSLTSALNRGTGFIKDYIAIYVELPPDEWYGCDYDKKCESIVNKQKNR